MIFKLLHGKFPLANMFKLLTLLSAFVHFRTFFLMPLKVPKSKAKISLFHSSVVGLMTRRRSRKTKDLKNDLDEKAADEVKSSLLDVVKTVPFWAFMIYYNVIAMRIRNIPGKNLYN